MSNLEQKWQPHPGDAHSIHPADFRYKALVAPQNKSVVQWQKVHARWLWRKKLEHNAREDMNATAVLSATQCAAK